MTTVQKMERKNMVKRKKAAKTEKNWGRELQKMILRKEKQTKDKNEWSFSGFHFKTYYT